MLIIPSRDKPKLDARIQLLWNSTLDYRTVFEFAAACYNDGREWERHLYGDGHSGWHLAAVEKGVILNALVQCEGNKLKTSRLLGISKTTLYRRLREMGRLDEGESNGE